MKNPTFLVILLLPTLTLLALTPSQANTTVSHTLCPTQIDGQGMVRSIRSLESIEVILIAGGDRQSITVALTGRELIPPTVLDSPRLVEQLRDLVELAPVYVDIRNRGGERPEALLLVPLNLTHLLNVNVWLIERAGARVDSGCRVVALEQVVEAGQEADSDVTGGAESVRRGFMDFALILLLIFALLVVLVIVVSLYG